MTVFRRKKAMARLYAVLHPDSSGGGAHCSEPELVLEAAILDTVLAHEHTLHFLQSLGLQVEPSLLSGQESDRLVSYGVMHDFLVQGRNSNLRALSVEHAATVATKLELEAKKHGNTKRLMDAIGASYQFAKSVLVAMEKGDLEDIKKRKKKRTAVTETEWPTRIMEALMLQENTRMHPGKATCSVAYGVRKEKIWLRKTKRQFVEELRKKYEDEDPPSVATLLTLIPKNFRRPGEKDRENNVCVKHSNMGHLTRKLRPALPSIPSSSRELSALVMCPPSDSNPYSVLDPLTWNKECALR